MKKTFDIQLSAYFKLSEFCVTSAPYDVFIIPPFVYRNITSLVNEVLEPLRVACNFPIRISSGYRPQDLNSLIGGAKNSYHLFGLAVDIYFNNKDDYQTAWDFLCTLFYDDKRIAELLGTKSKTWLHVSLNNHPLFNKHIINENYYE